MTRQGSDVLWAGFSIFAASSLIVLFIAHQRRRGHRTFHYLSAAILVTATIAYFIMASNLGNTPIETEFNRGSNPGDTRSVFYARYVLLLSSLASQIDRDKLTVVEGIAQIHRLGYYDSLTSPHFTPRDRSSFLDHILHSLHRCCDDVSFSFHSCSSSTGADERML